MEIKSSCKCGAIFEASGNPVSVGFRHLEFLSAHTPCREQKEEEGE